MEALEVGADFTGTVVPSLSYNSRVFPFVIVNVILELSVVATLESSKWVESVIERIVVPLEIPADPSTAIPFTNPEVLETVTVASLFTKVLLDKVFSVPEVLLQTIVYSSSLSLRILWIKESDSAVLDNFALCSVPGRFSRPLATELRPLTCLSPCEAYLISAGCWEIPLIKLCIELEIKGISGI